MNISLFLAILLAPLACTHAQFTLPYQSITGPTDGDDDSTTYSLPRGAHSTGSDSSLIFTCPTSTASAGVSLGHGPVCTPPSPSSTEPIFTIQTSLPPGGVSSSSSSGGAASIASLTPPDSSSSPSSTPSATTQAAANVNVNAARKLRSAPCTLPGEKLGLGMAGTLLLGLSVLLGVVLLLDWALLVL
jgi:hypothetical protein